MTGASFLENRGLNVNEVNVHILEIFYNMLFIPEGLSPFSHKQESEEKFVEFLVV
jgi:hypothetical protein